MESLPNELLIDIISRLPKGGIVAIAQTNKKMHSLATPILYRNLSLLIVWHRGASYKWQWTANFNERVATRKLSALARSSYNRHRKFVRDIEICGTDRCYDSHWSPYEYGIDEYEDILQEDMSSVMPFQARTQLWKNIASFEDIVSIKINGLDCETLEYPLRLVALLLSSKHKLEHLDMTGSTSRESPEELVVPAVKEILRGRNIAKLRSFRLDFTGPNSRSEPDPEEETPVLYVAELFRDAFRNLEILYIPQWMASSSTQRHNLEDLPDRRAQNNTQTVWDLHSLKTLFLSLCVAPLSLNGFSERTLQSITTIHLNWSSRKEVIMRDNPEALEKLLTELARIPNPFTLDLGVAFEKKAGLESNLEAIYSHWESRHELVRTMVPRLTTIRFCSWIKFPPQPEVLHKIDFTSEVLPRPAHEIPDFDNSFEEELYNGFGRRVLGLEGIYADEDDMEGPQQQPSASTAGPSATLVSNNSAQSDYGLTAFQEWVRDMEEVRDTPLDRDTGWRAAQAVFYRGDGGSELGEQAVFDEEYLDPDSEEPDYP